MGSVKTGTADVYEIVRPRAFKCADDGLIMMLPLHLAGVAS